MYAYYSNFSDFRIFVYHVINGVVKNVNWGLAFFPTSFSFRFRFPSSSFSL